MFGVFYMSEITLILLNFRSVPDVTPSSSTMDWIVPCSVHDTRNIFSIEIIFNTFCNVFVQGPRFTSLSIISITMSYCKKCYTNNHLLPESAEWPRSCPLEQHKGQGLYCRVQGQGQSLVAGMPHP